MNIFGGKITTYRRLAEAALEKIEKQIGAKGKPWTAKSVLPGGDFGVDEVEARIRGALHAIPVPGACACPPADPGFTARAPGRCSATPARRAIPRAPFRRRSLCGRSRTI